MSFHLAPSKIEGLDELLGESLSRRGLTILAGNLETGKTMLFA